MFAFCLAIFAVFGVVLVLVGANQDALASALGIGLAESGLLTSLLALGIGTGMAGGGVLADRLPRRLLAAGSVLVAAAALLGVSHDMSLARLGVQIFVLGAGAGVANVVFNVVVVERYAEDASRRLIVFHSAATLGAIAGPGLVAALSDPGQWTPAFRAIGVAYLALLLWLLVVPFGVHAATTGSNTASAGGGQRLALAALCVTAFAYLGAEAAITVFAIPYAEGLGLSGDRGRSAISAFWFGLLAGRLCILGYRGPLDARVLVGAGLSASAVLGFASLQLTNQVEWMLGFAGFAMGPVFPLLVGLAARTLPMRPGLATGWLTGFGSLGGFALPWITGEIGDRTDVGTVFTALAACTLLLVAAAAVAHRLRERPAPVAGLCASCRHARRIGNQRGSEFWQCRRAESDPAFRRYPELPVVDCSGHEPGEVLL